MHLLRVRALRLIGATGGAAAMAIVLAACGGSSGSSNSITAPSAVVTTDTFTGTVDPGGTKVHTFTVTTPGAVSITMTAAGPPATISMGLGIGNPNSAGNCGLQLPSTRSVCKTLPARRWRPTCAN